MKIKVFGLLLLMVVLSCKKSPPIEEYHKGNLTILTDASFESVTQALADGYMMTYPDTKINVETKKEDHAFLDLLQGKAKIIVMSRDLNGEEIKEYERVMGLKYRPDRFAADAVVFVVPKDSPLQSISMDEIIDALHSEEKKLIFDGTNSSNLNFVAQKINKKPSDLKFSILSGNENVIQNMEKYPGKIGVVALNSFSRPYSKEAEELRNKVKILPVTVKGKSISPEILNLANMSYPFTRTLYFLTSEANFSMANGFIRFSCTHIGQMIVQKEGLQKYNLYQREVKMY